MPTKTVDIREVEQHLSELLSLVSEGTEIVVTQNDAPLARILPPDATLKSRVPGLHPGAFVVADDFDEPLPDEFWTGTE